MVTVNVTVLAGTIAGEPVARRMPSGDEVLELRVSAPEEGVRALPLPVVVWKMDVGEEVFEAVRGLERGAEVLVSGKLIKRFYRSGAGARSLTEVVARSVRRLEWTSDEAAFLAAVTEPVLPVVNGSQVITFEGTDYEAHPEHGVWYEVGRVDEVGAMSIPMNADGSPDFDNVGEVLVRYQNA